MWDWIVETWPFWSIPLWVSAGFVLCGVMANGRIEDAFMEAEARMDHARFVRDEAVRDAAEMALDGIDWP